MSPSTQQTQRQPCRFCGSRDSSVDGGIDNEHIWGEWYSRWLYEAGVVAKGTELEAHWGPPDNPKPAGRAKRVNLKIRRACRKCNGGWMSGLEDKAKDIFLPGLIVRSPTDLSPYDQRTLAAWATLLAMEMDLAVTTDRTAFYRQMERDWLRVTGTPPACTTVWIGKHKEHRLLAWGYPSDLYWDIKVEGTKWPSVRGYVLTFTVGLVVMQVLTHRLPPVHGVIQHPFPSHALDTPGVFNQIWPVLDRLHYNPTQAFERKGLTRLTNRWSESGFAEGALLGVTPRR